MNYWISAETHQKWIDLEPKRMAIRRKKAMLAMCKEHGQCTQDELDEMQKHIDDLKVELWKAEEKS